MPEFSDYAMRPGDIMRRIRALEQGLQELQAGRRLEASQISRGILQLSSEAAFEALGPDVDGDRVADIGGGSFGVGNLIAGSIESPDVLQVLHTDDELELHVNSATGSDDMGDGSAGSPFATIQQAIDSMPGIINGSLQITVNQNHVEQGSLDIAGLIGGGDLTIVSSHATNRPKLNGHITVRGCMPNVILRRLDIHPGGDHPNGVFAGRSIYVQVSDCLIRGGGNVDWLVRFQRCRGRVIDTDGRGGDVGIFAVDGSIVTAIDNTGSVDSVGYRANGSTIYASGTRWSAPTPVSEQAGGQVLGVPVADPSPPPPPPASTTVRTSTWSATRTESWRTRHSRWRFQDSTGANSFPYQGEYRSGGNHRGFWFFNSSNIRSTLSGRTIRSVRFRVTRRDSGGNAAARRPTFRLHNFDGPTGGRPSLQSAAHTGPGFRWGQNRTVKLPTWWGERLRDGDSRGIAIYTGSKSPYMIFAPRGTLIIEHEG